VLAVLAPPMAHAYRSPFDVENPLPFGGTSTDFITSTTSTTSRKAELRTLPELAQFFLA
jgi:hypothetical protein